MASVLSCILRSRKRMVCQILPACLQLVITCPPAVNFQWAARGNEIRTISTEQRRGTLHEVSEELRVVSSTLTEAEYHHVADEALESMAENLEAYVEFHDIEGGDVECSQGVLTVKLGKHGTFVINKQTPNRQMWLSSPVSGPFRFDYEDGRWIYNRDRRDLVKQLEQEISSLVGSKLKLE